MTRRSVRQKLTLPGIGPSLNVFYAGKHWSQRSKYKNQWQTIVRVCVQAQRLIPITDSAELTFEFYFGKGMKRYDASNCAMAAKLIEDGLVACEIIPDDSPHWVCGIRLYSLEDRSHPTGYTVVTIVP